MLRTMAITNWLVEDQQEALNAFLQALMYNCKTKVSFSKPRIHRTLSLLNA